MIKIVPLKPKEIDFLQKTDCLYTSDFRATGEALDWAIPAMWKYENLMPWILRGQRVTINERTTPIRYPHENILCIVKRAKDSRKSVYARLATLWRLRHIRSLWVAVPHPDADSLAKKKGLKLNYSYRQFILRNDKLKQKHALGSSTPRWQVVSHWNHVLQIHKEKRHGFLKRRHGSGGFTVFPLRGATRDKRLQALFSTNPYDWYFEEFVEGGSYSIQCVKQKNGTVTIFGYSEQILTDTVRYAGSRLLRLETLPSRVERKLRLAIKRLKPILRGYEGFFGIDFIVSYGGRVQVLECNVRLTAVTIPTLLYNMIGAVNTEYHEDVPVRKIDKHDLVLVTDSSMKCHDIMTFHPAKNCAGKRVFFDLRGCRALVPELSENMVDQLRGYINTLVGSVTRSCVYNFWPFGWTACFILEESHCVVSGWYLEKRVLVDVFSCHPAFDARGFHARLVRFFDSTATEKPEEHLYS